MRNNQVIAREHNKYCQLNCEKLESGTKYPANEAWLYPFQPWFHPWFVRETHPEQARHICSDRGSRKARYQNWQASMEVHHSEDNQETESAATSRKKVGCVQFLIAAKHFRHKSSRKSQEEDNECGCYCPR